MAAHRSRRAHMAGNAPTQKLQAPWPPRTALRGHPARPAGRQLAPGAGDWPHGWQYHASRTLTVHSRDRVLLPSLPPGSRALLRSQAACRSMASMPEHGSLPYRATRQAASRHIDPCGNHAFVQRAWVPRGARGRGTRTTGRSAAVACPHDPSRHPSRRSRPP